MEREGDCVSFIFMILLIPFKDRNYSITMIIRNPFYIRSFQGHTAVIEALEFEPKYQNRTSTMHYVPKNPAKRAGEKMGNMTYLLILEYQDIADFQK